MVQKYFDRVSQSVSGAPGGGDVALGGALAGYQTLVQAGAVNGDTFSYLIVDGTAWEFGLGTFVSAGLNGSVQRTSVTRSSLQSTAPISASSRATISAILRAEDLAALQSATTLQGMGDVSINEGVMPDKQILIWDIGLGKFTAHTLVYADITDPPAIPSNADFYLQYLHDVSVALSSGTDGYVLSWNNTTSRFSLVAQSGGGGGGGATTLHALTDVNVTEGSGIDGYVLKWDNGTSKWIASATGGGFSGAYSDLTGKPTLFSGSYTDLTSKPTIPTTLETLTDVNVTTGSGINGYSLVWDNATGKWIASNISGGGGGGSSTLSGLTDVSLTSVTTNQVLEWNGSHWVNTTLTLFSGAYSDLTGKPTLFSGSYTDLTSKPTIPTTLAALTDVNVTEGSGINGYYLKWDNGTSKWIAATVSGGGSLSSLSDVNVTEGSGINNKYLRWDNGAGKWIADTPTAAGPGGSPPTVVQFGDVSANATAPSVTMGSAPTSGNLLFAFVYSDGGNPAATSGWTLIASASSGTWYNYIYQKTAGGSESATQSPVTGTSGHWAIGIWEVSGANATTPVLAAVCANQMTASAFLQAQLLNAPNATLYLSALISSTVAQALGTPFNVTTVDGNLSSGAGGKPCFGHSDSFSSIYGMNSIASASTNYNSTFLILQH